MSKALKAIGFLAFILLFTLAPLGFVLGAKMLKGDLACRVVARIVITFGIIAFALIVIGKVSIFASEAFIAGWFIMAAFFLAPLVAWGGVMGIAYILYPKMTMKYHTSIHQKAKIHK